MWMKNNYVRTLAAIAVAALFLLAFVPENSSADGSEDAAEVPSVPTPAAVIDSFPSQTAPSPQSRQFQVPAQPPQGFVPPPQPQAFVPQPAQLSPQIGVAPRLPSRPIAPSNGRQLDVAYGQAGFVQPVVSATHAPLQPTSLADISSIGKGLPDGDWIKHTPLGVVKMAVSGNKVSINVEGAGEFAMFKPSLRGEYSIASDGTIYGLIHSVDLGIATDAAQEMDEEWILLSGLSDIPFSMRAYSEPSVLAIKQVTFGLPTLALIATDGEASQIPIYAQSMIAGQYELRRLAESSAVDR